MTAKPRQSTTILALDLGTTLGWALGPPAISGTHSLKGGRYEGGGMRYLRFERWLDEMLDLSGGLGAVYFEEVRGHKGTSAAHIYGGLLAVLTKWCEVRAIPYQGVPVGTIKKHATGKGNAGKEQVIAAVREWGFAPRDDNEADALALFRYVKDEL